MGRPGSKGDARMIDDGDTTWRDSGRKGYICMADVG
jgi:hypothetical protein